MALTVGSDTYISVSDADTYASNHFISDDVSVWNNASTSNKEAALRQATQYIDSRFRDRFVGVIQSTAQSLEWPRTNAVDRSGRTLTGTPQVVKDATVELAKERLVADGNLVPVEDRGGKVKREAVGSIEVEYMDGAPPGRTYKFAEMLLSQVLRKGGKKLNRV